MPPHCSIPPELAGTRLDAALALLRPELGLRARKRLIAQGLVRLDGRPATKGTLVLEGQRLEILTASLEISPDPHPPQPAPCILARNETYAALAKPAGLHTAALVGKAGDLTLEALLPQLLPDWPEAVLLNRLDRPTSGLVLAGRTAAARGTYQVLEDRGQVDKRYLLLVHGVLTEPLSLRAPLDMARRTRTRVLPGEAEPLRWTELRPLQVLGSEAAPGCDGLAPGSAPCTLALARIRKGARHQIRAHCAAAGYPLLGDALYGQAPADAPLFLHHARVSLPGFEAQWLPEWLAKDLGEAGAPAAALVQFRLETRL